MEKLDALVEKLKKYGYDVHTFENAQQAKNYLLETIPQTDTVGIGGSMTVQQMGLDQAAARPRPAGFLALGCAGGRGQ